MGQVFRSTDDNLPAEVRSLFDGLVKRKRFTRINVETKAFDPAGPMTIEGIANLASEDRWGEVIVPDAWKKRMGTFKANPIILLEHDRTKPIGRCMDVQIK